MAAPRSWLGRAGRSLKAFGSSRVSAAEADLPEVLSAMAALPYGGEAVDQRAHALLCAGHALAAGADDELVTACLLHDVGRVPEVARTWRSLPHERAGERWCAVRFGPRTAWLVGAHVDAKRYLVSTDTEYAAELSPASVRSLRVQGGALDAGGVRAFEDHPWATDAVRLRRWDEAAKDPSAPLPPLDQVLAAARHAVGRAGEREWGADPAWSVGPTPRDDLLGWGW